MLLGWWLHLFLLLLLSKAKAIGGGGWVVLGWWLHLLLLLSRAMVIGGGKAVARVRKSKEKKRVR